MERERQTAVHPASVASCLCTWTPQGDTWTTCCLSWFLLLQWVDGMIFETMTCVQQDVWQTPSVHSDCQPAPACRPCLGLLSWFCESSTVKACWFFQVWLAASCFTLQVLFPPVLLVCSTLIRFTWVLLTCASPPVYGLTGHFVFRLFPLSIWPTPAAVSRPALCFWIK